MIRPPSASPENIGRKPLGPQTSEPLVRRKGAWLAVLGIQLLQHVLNAIGDLLGSTEVKLGSLFAEERRDFLSIKVDAIP